MFAERAMKVYNYDRYLTSHLGKKKWRCSRNYANGSTTSGDFYRRILLTCSWHSIAQFLAVCSPLTHLFELPEALPTCHIKIMGRSHVGLFHSTWLNMGCYAWSSLKDHPLWILHLPLLWWLSSRNGDSCVTATGHKLSSSACGYLAAFPFDTPAALRDATPFKALQFFYWLNVKLSQSYPIYLNAYNANRCLERYLTCASLSSVDTQLERTRDLFDLKSWKRHWTEDINVIETLECGFLSRFYGWNILWGFCTWSEGEVGLSPVHTSLNIEHRTMACPWRCMLVFLPSQSWPDTHQIVVRAYILCMNMEFLIGMYVPILQFGVFCHIPHKGYSRTQHFDECGWHVYQWISCRGSKHSPWLEW